LYLRFLILFSFVLTAIILVNGSPFKRHVKRATDCDPYPYCNGQNFPNKVKLDNYFIVCNQAISARDRCCLPQAKHLICYNIMVNGTKLNFDSSSNFKSTDYTGLCRAMADTMGHRPGKHSSAVVENTGTDFVWRYGEFFRFEHGMQAGTKHVKDLACEILL